jgi:hypothetical protein
MSLKTVNKDIACSPFPAHSVEPKKLASGFVMAAPRTNLVPLKVLADYAPFGLYVGDTVWVPLEFSNSVWGKRRLDIGQGEFILVPADQVHLVTDQGK